MLSAPSTQNSNLRPILKATVFLGILLSEYNSARACGGIFDVACNLSNGGLSPQNVVKQTDQAVHDAGSVAAQGGQALANALNELQASSLTGPALEAAIAASRSTALAGSMPIPADMRSRLQGYASEDSMNRVRYKIGDPGFANLAHLIEQGGKADAVTLVDLVIFHGPSEAADPSIWAHELTHVDQYRDWGLHNFAVSYTRNWHSVEEPAYAKGDGYWAWWRQHNDASASNPVHEVHFITGDGKAGVLQQVGSQWNEFSDSKFVFSFHEMRRDANFIYLDDNSRNMELAVPIAGGISEWRLLSENNWHNYVSMVPLGS